MTQRTIVSIASLTAWNNRRIVSRVAGAALAAASANRSVNTMIGSMEPPEAAAMGFVGTSETSHPASDCFGSAARSRAASAAPAGRGGAFTPRAPNSPKTALVMGTTTTARNISIATKTSSVLPPSRPTAFTAVADATLVTMSDTMSGITVIRIAFTQMAPIGSM